MESALADCERIGKRLENVGRVRLFWNGGADPQGR